MTNWLISSNPRKFQLAEFLRKYEYVDWKQGNTKFKVGDMVYIYSASPIQRIESVFEVIGVDIPTEESVRDEAFWTDKNEFRAGVTQNRYVRLKLKECISSENLSLDNLKKHGLNGAPQGRVKIKPELLDYINSVLD